MVSLVAALGAFTYGLSTSTTLCFASCLPVYLPILVGYGDSVRKGFRLSLGFAVGRFIGYFILGVAAALMGAAFIDFFQYTFPGISATVLLAFGLLTVLYGVLMLSKSGFTFLGRGRCKMYVDRVGGYGSPLLGAGLLGFVSTITPCVPVFTFLLLPFAMGKVLETAVITVFFGLGANVVFILLGVAAAFGVENISERFEVVKRKLEVFSGFALIVFGLFYVLWSLGPSLGWGNQYYALPSVYDFIAFLKHLLQI